MRDHKNLQTLLRLMWSVSCRAHAACGLKLKGVIDRCKREVVYAVKVRRSESLEKAHCPGQIFACRRRMGVKLGLERSVRTAVCQEHEAGEVKATALIATCGGLRVEQLASAKPYDSPLAICRFSGIHFTQQKLA